MPDFLTEPVPNDEAAAFIANKPAVTREVFNKLLPELKARAFTITGLETAAAVQNVREAIATLPQGGDWDTIKRDIAAQMSPYFIDEDADAETQAGQRYGAERRAELILRLHGFQAYSAGAHAALTAQSDIFTHWQYKSMGDGKVRATHRALQDIVLPAGDEFWRGHYPPWEWGCRCQVVGLMDIDVEEIRAADQDKPLESRRIIEGEARTQLVEKGHLVKGPNEIFDVRTPKQKGKPGAFGWDPADLRLPIEELKSRYEPEVWENFEQWARGQEITGQARTVWDWLTTDIVAAPAGPSWPTLAKLTAIRKLGGSTGATLMKAPDGQQYVVKRGNSPAHIREELLADILYAALSVSVPEARIEETDGGPAKVARHIEGQTLAEYLRTTKGPEKDITLALIQENFVADALLANYDVIGLELDNILIGKDGTPWRIDNGGSLRFRAQGKSKTFGPEVTELNTMRDPNINPAAAKIFGAIDDAEINRQIRRILEKREALLAAAPDDIRPILSARLDSLERRLAPAGQLTPQFATEVKKSRILGRTYLGDFEHIEDHSILFWQELDASRQPITRAKLRFTIEGNAAIQAKIGDLLRAATPATNSGPQPLTTDSYWPAFHAALKTVNHHVTDGSYNANTMAQFNQAAAQLAAFVPKTTDEKAMKKAYEALVADIQAATAAKTATKQYTQFLVAPKAVKPPAPGDIKAEVTNLVYTSKTRERGHATEQVSAVKTISGAYRLTLGDVELSFAPWTSATPYAHRGVATIRIKGESTPERMQQALDLIKEVGIDASPTPPATNELLYLRKSLQFAKPGGDWQDILTTAPTDEDRVTALKAWVKKKMKIDLATDPAYQPAGSGNAWDDGWKAWTRWDLPPATIAAELAGYGLTHHTSGSLHEFVSSVLDGGGQVTPTMERMRVGIGVSAGMSPDADQGTGGANYFFTRIASPDNVKRHRGLVFKIDRLSRADAWSFPSDYFGDVRPAGENSHTKDPQKTRGKKIADYKKFATHGSNETIFKHGFHLLDDIDFINTANSAERQAILQVFAKHGITTLPDGRQISDIVK